MSSKYGGALDVSGLVVPRVEIAVRNVDRVPLGVATENFSVLLREHFLMDRLLNRGLHFFGRRPDLAQENVFAGAILAERFIHQIEIHAAGERVGNHQRRRSQIIRANQRIDAAFEIAIPGEHCGDGELSALHGRRDCRREAVRYCRCR